jgi:RNase H
MEKTIHIFTDGSAIRNPGPGGWAAILIRGSKSWEMSGAPPWTTISELELSAAVEALRSLPSGSLVELRLVVNHFDKPCDSLPVEDGRLLWQQGALRNNGEYGPWSVRWTLR